MSDALARALRWGKNQFSLDPQPEQDLLSPETAGDMALGMIPGVGQAMALRDMERARRADDPVAGGLAATGLIPFGKLAGALRKSEVIAGKAARHAPLDEIAAGEGMLKRGESPTKVWQEMGTYRGTENHAPMKWEIPDQKARLKKDAPGWVGGGEDWAYQGKLGELLHHPELFRNYPELADYNVLGHRSPNATGEGGFWKREREIDATGKNSRELLSTLLHEVQHGIQNLEGFDSGASYSATKKALQDRYGTTIPASDLDKMSFRTYQRNMGEAEARAVETRRGNPKSVNELLRPTMSYDVSIASLIPEDQMPYYVKRLRP